MGQGGSRGCSQVQVQGGAVTVVTKRTRARGDQPHLIVGGGPSSPGPGLCVLYAVSSLCLVMTVMRHKQRRGNGDGDGHQSSGGGGAYLVMKGGRGRGHCHQHGPSLAQFRMEVVPNCHRRRIYICWLMLVKMLNCIKSFNLMIMLWNWCGKKFVVFHDKLLLRLLIRNLEDRLFVLFMIMRRWERWRTVKERWSIIVTKTWR